jgi:plastocyanin
MRRRLGVAALGLVLALTIAGCGSDGDDAGASGSGGAGGAGGHGGTPAPLDHVVVVNGPEAEVKVLDNSFNDQNIQVAPGTKVVWTNDGRQDHDIRPAEGHGWGVEPADFGPQAVYEQTFDEPGTYRYFCSLHGTADAGMIGAIVVKP